MVSLLLNRAIYSSALLHPADVKEKSDGFGVWTFPETRNCSFPLAKHLAASDRP